MAAQIVDAQFVRSHIGKLPIIDVRPAELYDEGHIPTAINVCVADFDRFGAEEADEFSKECRRFIWVASTIGRATPKTRSRNSPPPYFCFACERGVLSLQ
ncbi:MAG: rhodanese-like domain-containing protein [Eggerthella sp.]|nr:rhodanese-like domain-containing protein [Eggerthella sp.]